MNQDGASVTYAPNTISNVVVSSGRATAHSATKAVLTTILDKGEMVVFVGTTFQLKTERFAPFLPRFFSAFY